MNVVAIISVFNEEDIVEYCISDLIEQGIGVYVLDDASTDRSPAILERFRARGLIGVERLERPDGGYRLTDHLIRKQELTAEIDADWFISHDADEFREGPWHGLNLKRSIELVDRLGYNAIDFEMLNFWPTRELGAGEDPRVAFTGYKPATQELTRQTRVWKRQPAIDLVTLGGHEVLFAGRKVFPTPFLLRHYPVRGQVHGERKVFRERLPRYDTGEVANGWHVHYDRFKSNPRFLCDPATLTPYDPDVVRAGLGLANRELRNEVARALDLEIQLGELATTHLETLARLEQTQLELLRATEVLRALQAARVATNHAPVPPASMLAG